MLEKLDDILLAFLSGGAATAMINQIPRLVKVIQAKQPKKALEDVSWIYDQIYAIKTLTDSPYVWLGKSTNGGGIPRLGQPLYHSICYASDHQVSDTWENAIVDQGHATLLSRATTTEISILHTRFLKGPLKDHFDRREIESLFLFHVLMTPTTFYYLGVGRMDARILEMKAQISVAAICKGMARRLS